MSDLQKFRNPFSVPPGRRWFYQVPNGKFIESVYGLDDCAERVRKAYKAAELDIPDNVELLIQDYMCASLPAGFCTGKPTISNPTWTDVKNSTEKMVKAAEAARKAGPQLMQVVERRAKACLTCPEHSLGMCITCNGLLGAFDHFRKNRRTQFDRNVRVCRACAGLLPVVLQLGAEYVKPVAGFEFPDNCWVKEELANG